MSQGLSLCPAPWLLAYSGHSSRHLHSSSSVCLCCPSVRLVPPLVTGSPTHLAQLVSTICQYVWIGSSPLSPGASGAPSGHGSSTHLISSFLPSARASSTHSSRWLVLSPGPGSLFCLLVCLVPPLITTSPTHLDQFVSIVCLLFGNWLGHSLRSSAVCWCVWQPL